MPDILAAFPRRPLVLKPGRGSLGAWLTALVGTLLFGTFLVIVAVEIAPAIRDDFAQRDTARAAAAVRIAEGRCRSRAFLFQSCDLTLEWRDKDGAHTRRVSYMFVEPHMGSWTAQAMADPARPDRVTTDLGLDRLWNRVATAAGGVVFVIAVILGLVLQLRKAQAKGRELRALSRRPLAPVAVRFRGWGPGPSWQVEDERGVVSEWPVRKSDLPFMLDAARGMVLALRDPAGGAAFPLDEKLRLVRLSAEERARIEAARWSRHAAAG